ncbi:MAG: hypothetical protein V1792_05885 [Pseudomonadota bacterium]
MVRNRVVALALAMILLPLAGGDVWAQGIQTSPYSAPSVLRGRPGAGLDLAPSNPLGLPGSSAPAIGASDTIPISSGMFPSILPPIPNLQVGYLYYFGQNVRSGRFTADYLLPFSLSKNSTVFGEAHTEFQSFWKTNNGFNNRVDLSLGGGYRSILSNRTLVGVNGFYDTSRLGEKWYSSGSLGFELAALVSGSDALDLSFNWYGKLFNGNVIRNAFRYGPGNFDVQAGYSHELWDGGPDMRLKVAAYQFNIGDNVYGWNAGAELKTRDGVFSLRYDVGNDKINRTYQTVGGFVNIGLQLDNLLRGESPFTKPEPIFRSPRNLWRMLTQNVYRNWYQPEEVVQNRPRASGATPYFVFSLGPIDSGRMTYREDPGNATGTMIVGAAPSDRAEYYRLTVVGTNGLTFPLTATITPARTNAFFIMVRQDDVRDSPETVTFPDSSTLTSTVPPDGNSGPPSPAGVPEVRSNRVSGAIQGTITITAPGVQTLTITIVEE